MGDHDGKAALKGRALLLEDDDVIRDVVAGLLQRLGLRVTAVEEGTVAIAAFEAAMTAQDPFDLVILDLTIPAGMGGAEALARLRALDPGVRAVASSGDSVRAGPAFQATLSKPYTREDLQAVLGPLLRR